MGTLLIAATNTKNERARLLFVCW